jgi:hypothetical protein
MQPNPCFANSIFNFHKSYSLFSPSVPDDPEAEIVYENNQAEESRMLLQLFPRPSNVDVGQIPELNRYLKDAYLSSSQNTPQDDLYRHMGQHMMQVLYGVVPVLLKGRQQNLTDAEFAAWSQELELALFALKGQNIALDVLAKLRSCHLYHKVCVFCLIVGIYGAIYDFYGFPMLVPTSLALEESRHVAYSQVWCLFGAR